MNPLISTATALEAASAGRVTVTNGRIVVVIVTSVCMGICDLSGKYNKYFYRIHTVIVSVGFNSSLFIAESPK